jgi:uncharacterized protein (TIGR00369 family)
MSAVPPIADSPHPHPFHELVGLTVELAEGGRSRTRLAVEEHHLREGGIVHGGVLATLLDVAIGVAARSLAPDGPDLVTIQLNVHFVRATRAGEVLVASGEVLHPGRRTVVARGEIRTVAGDLVALGTGTLFYLPPPPQ